MEEHYVTTTDGYILKLFRIPCPGCPVVFFMHGLGSSSDFFVLNGCDNSLPYILANGNYDIWFGNARGNVYSRNHTTLSPDQRKFWAFSWHEIGKYDVPEIIDYILNNTSQTALHYIGHNQGATTFFVMLSEKPSYKNKIKECHLFAPIAYLNNSQSPLLSFLGPILGQPSEILNVLGSTELSYKNNYTNLICAEYSPLLPLCEDFLLLVVGPSIANLNQVGIITTSIILIYYKPFIYPKIPIDIIPFLFGYTSIEWFYTSTISLSSALQFWPILSI